LCILICLSERCCFSSSSVARVGSFCLRLGLGWLPFGLRELGVLRFGSVKAKKEIDNIMKINMRFL
jgi:hypothetical protein